MVIVCVTLSGCADNFTIPSQPKKVKILKEGGLPVRSEIHSESDVIFLSHKGDTYEVIEGIASYYKIQLNLLQSGWMVANPRERWTEEVPGGKVKILMNGIPVKKHLNNPTSRVLKRLKRDEVYRIIEVKYSHLEIVLLDENEGWIEIGDPKSKWVKILIDDE